MTIRNTATSKTERLMNFLKSGQCITARQATARFGIRNLSSVVSNLRFQGYAVYCNQKTNSDGDAMTVYRLGTPSREVVAAGYRALADGMIVA